MQSHPPKHLGSRMAPFTDHSGNNCCECLLLADFCLSPPSVMWLGTGDHLNLRVGWSDGVRSSPGYDYRPLMFEASIDTNLLGDPW